MSEDPQALDGFSGVARLFPLPNLVLFPGVVQPLHIFEPRYREMMTDALTGDRLLAIVLLQPGWEEEYSQRPPVHQIACLGRIFNEERLADGQFNLLLHGVRRIRIENELPADRLYREARVHLLNDVRCDDPAREQQLRGKMSAALPQFLASHGGDADQVRRLLEGELQLGMLADIFIFALPFEAEFKQRMLEELDEARRAEQLLSQIEQMIGPEASDRAFPPEFSDN